MLVPFLDLQSHHAPIRAELITAFEEVLSTGAFAGGPFVAKFESEFASYCQTRHAVGVGSGTEALWFCLLACGIGPGDEVITSPSTFMATAEAVSFCGATPVFVDIREDTYAMDPELLEAAITPRSRAVIPVHLFGQVADMDPILEIARRHNLYVIEDACQAHGADYKGRRAGSLGHAGCFSFYPGKNLGALGEAGAVVTNDFALSERIKILRDHGQEARYHHAHVGWNGRMDGIQAAVLSIKLKGLERANESRRAHARAYSAALADVEGVVTPFEAPHGRHVFHVYAVRVPERDAIQKGLTRHGIGSGIHYPVPVHLQKAYAHLGLGRGSFPVAERCASEFLSLPMFPELTPVQVEEVVQVLCEVISTGVRREAALA